MAQAQPLDPAAVQALVQRGFDGAPFVKDVGLQFVACGAGWCEASLDLQPRHFQHTGVVHAGVITTLADHCAGGAGAAHVRTRQSMWSRSSSRSTCCDRAWASG